MADFFSMSAAAKRLSSDSEEVSDAFERTLLWGSLWDSVREADFAPREFLELALRLLPAETDESLAQSLIGHVTTGLHRYVSDAARAQIVPNAETLASDRMLHSTEQDFRIIWFRGLRAIAESPQGTGATQRFAQRQTRRPWSRPPSS